MGIKPIIQETRVPNHRPELDATQSRAFNRITRNDETMEGTMSYYEVAIKAQMEKGVKMEEHLEEIRRAMDELAQNIIE